jgi:HORMA domain
MFYDFKILQQTQTPPAMSFQLMLPAPVEARHVSPDTTSGKTEVQLSQEQSLCLVKIFINASLGCICFSRGLIPSDSPTYQDRRVDDLSLIPLTSSLASYHSFLSYQGELSVDNESQVFKVLLGGKDKRADHILNLVVCHRSHVSVG